MNRNDIVIGSYYYFVFSNNWPEANGMYRVNGYASPDVVSMMDQSQDLHKEWFENYGYESSMYDKYIDKNTLIYVCTKITSASPLTEDTEKNLYIPTSLISFQDSYNMVEGYKLRYLITTNPRIFNSEKARNEFKSESKKTVIESINESKEFVADVLDVEMDEIKVLTTASEVEEREKEALKISDLTLMAKQQYESNKEASERQLYLSTKAAEAAERRYNDAKSLVDVSASDYASALNNIQNKLEGIKRIEGYIINSIAELMSRSPGIFDSTPGLPSTYTAETVYSTIYNRVTTDARESGN